MLDLKNNKKIDTQYNNYLASAQIIETTFDRHWTYISNLYILHQLKLLHFSTLIHVPISILFHFEIFRYHHVLFYFFTAVLILLKSFHVVVAIGIVTVKHKSILKIDFIYQKTTHLIHKCTDNLKITQYSIIQSVRQDGSRYF